MKLVITLILSVVNLKVSHALLRNVELEEELLAFWPSLFQSDINGLGEEVTYSLQAKSTTSGTDNAPKRLFHIVPFTKFTTMPTYATMIQLFDNYLVDVKVPEKVTDRELAEQDDFIAAILDTDVMRKAHEFLVQKGKASPDINEFGEYLKSIWFGLYNHYADILGSSGLEHVFLGEIRDDEVIGLHSWVRYFLEEKHARMNYPGFLDYRFIGRDIVLDVPISWKNGFKKSSPFFVGTSPELEIAMYTICLELLPYQECPIQRSGENGISVQANPVYHDGEIRVGSAYPILV